MSDSLGASITSADTLWKAPLTAPTLDLLRLEAKFGESNLSSYAKTEDVTQLHRPLVNYSISKFKFKFLDMYL